MEGPGSQARVGVSPVTSQPSMTSVASDTVLTGQHRHLSSRTILGAAHTFISLKLVMLPRDVVTAWLRVLRGRPVCPAVPQIFRKLSWDLHPDTEVPGDSVLSGEEEERLEAGKTARQ